MAKKPADPGTVRGRWNIALSALDPELEDLGNKIRKILPPGVSGHGMFGRIFGMVKGWAESKAEKLPPLLGAMLEKATDVGDFAVRGEGTLAKKATGEARATADDWTSAFIIYAMRRLAKARDKEQEISNLKKEFDAVCELVEMAKTFKVKQAPPKVETDFNLKEWWGKVDQALAQVAVPVQAFADWTGTFPGAKTGGKIQFRIPRFRRTRKVLRGAWANTLGRINLRKLKFWGKNKGAINASTV